MIAVLILIFGALALTATAFAVLPLVKRPSGVAANQPPGGEAAGLRFVRVGLAAATVLIVGLGVYASLGQPHLALQALQGPDTTDYRSMIAELAYRIRERPNDTQGWALLGSGYLALGDSAQAVAALRRAVVLAEMQLGAAPPALLASYGEALTANSDTVTPEAEAAFRAAYDQDAQHPNARFYLGLAHVGRGENEQALQYWDGLLAAAPPEAPWREFLFAQMATLTGLTIEPGQTQGPDIQAMVQRLADRLATEPDDLSGWLQLIRSYSVLEERDNALATLARARAHFAGNSEAENALAAEALASTLE